jgi:hypothetical protein
MNAGLSDAGLRALLVGGVLIGVGLLTAGLMKESALAMILVLAGAVLCLFSFLGDRLKSFGPKGIELFEQIRDRTADKMERSTSDEVAASDEVASSIERGVGANAAAAIRATQSPEELVDVLVGMMETPEPEPVRQERLRKDDSAQARQDQGPSAGGGGS